MNENYDVAQNETDWVVTNTRTDRTYDFSNKAQTDEMPLISPSYGNCSLKVPCRHIYGVHRHQNNAFFDPKDVLLKCFRTSYSASNIEVFTGVAEAAVTGLPDKDVADYDDEQSAQLAAPRFNTLRKRYNHALDIAKQIASTVSRHGSKDFQRFLNMLTEYIQ